MILGGMIKVLTLRQFPGAPPVVEDGKSYTANAVKKAVETAAWLTSQKANFPNGLPDFVLADDSGLEVDSLDGAPGVHSARYGAEESGAAENSTDAANNARLLRELAAVPLENRSAQFRCVLALASLGRGQPLQTFEGVCQGRIAFAAGGVGGFGYDPLFIPEGQEKSFAELDPDIKNRISHRARALEQLSGALLSPGAT